MQGRVTEKKSWKEKVKKKIPAEWIALSGLQTVFAWGKIGSHLMLEQF